MGLPVLIMNAFTKMTAFDATAVEKAGNGFVEGAAFVNAKSLPLLPEKTLEPIVPAPVEPKAFVLISAPTRHSGLASQDPRVAPVRVNEVAPGGI